MMGTRQRRSVAPTARRRWSTAAVPVPGPMAALTKLLGTGRQAHRDMEPIQRELRNRVPGLRSSSSPFPPSATRRFEEGVQMDTVGAFVSLKEHGVSLGALGMALVLVALVEAF